MDNKHPGYRALSLSLDTISYALISLLLVVTIAFSNKVPGWQMLVIQFLISAAVYTGIIWIVRRRPLGIYAVVLRTGAVLGLFSFLFNAVAGLQHTLVDRWMDGVLVSVEHSLTGTESSVWLQHFVMPFVTEGMMFSYVIYLPLLPLIAFICYWSGGNRASNDYLLNYSLANSACYLGFILFPVASPLYYQPELYTSPLTGGFFTWCGEWMRHNVHYAGGSLPSPHCASATIMAVMLYRYNRKMFYVLSPIISLLYISTVYGRYHYVWDAVAGIAAAAAVLKASPKIVTATESVKTFFERFPRAASVSEPVSES